MFAATGDSKECQPSTSSSTEYSQAQPSLQFEFSEILLATDNFDESLVIGHGGFGKVYKGIVTNGSSTVVAAIKRLDSKSSQGAAEFWAEVGMLSKLRHCHLVSLIGYCNYEKEMILVYEYMPNGTLADHLHRLNTPLSWIQRLKICIGAARGLDYLHTGMGVDFGVIHRDVKTSNILLDESWAAKISDFGLSKIGPTNQPSTYVNTLVKGTFGYLDPDYFFSGRLTRKSDVYAFGVVLLEVLCRKPALDRSRDSEQENLAKWVQESIRKGNLKHIIDAGIKGQISPKCLKEFVRIAERCLLHNRKQRPTMAEVVVNLESVLTLQVKVNSSLQPAGRTIFGRMVDNLGFASTSAHTDSKQPSDTKATSKNADNNDFKIPIPRLKAFKFGDLERATRNFHQDLLLGKGCFGEVFLGWVNKNTLAPSTEGVGTPVAVKRYNEGLTEWSSSQGLPEWQTVVTVLGRLAHPNIIGLLGYCDDKEHKCLLVYEYMDNQHLDHFLFGDVAEPLSWETRLTIMIGAARGLAYIHSSKDEVVHRDIKASNILLDKDFNAKLGDFALAKFGPEIQKLDETTRIMGTLGYIDPWYLRTGHVSMKSDIYSFGVVLLEILTGRRASEMEPSIYKFSLVEWTTPFLADTRRLKKIMDPCLGQNYSLEGAFQCVTLAIRCASLDRNDRSSGVEVLQSLEQIYDVKDLGAFGLSDLELSQDFDSNLGSLDRRFGIVARFW